jgi:hypothetical protein
MSVIVRLLLAAAISFGTCAFAADAPEKPFALNIRHGTVAGDERVIKVEKGDALRLRITSDTAGELHLHGYRLAAKVAPGATSELAFKAYATGRYPFEWHGSEPAAKTGANRAPPPATLEVRPK